jgi:hypothetical protein
MLRNGVLSADLAIIITTKKSKKKIKKKSKKNIKRPKQNKIYRARKTRERIPIAPRR